MGCAEGQSPFAGSMRVSLRYKFFPPSWQEGGQGEGREVFQHPARFDDCHSERSEESGEVGASRDRVKHGPSPRFFVAPLLRMTSKLPGLLREVRKPGREAPGKARSLFVDTRPRSVTHRYRADISERAGHIREVTV